MLRWAASWEGGKSPNLLTRGGKLEECILKIFDMNVDNALFSLSLKDMHVQIGKRKDTQHSIEVYI